MNNINCLYPVMLMKSTLTHTNSINHCLIISITPAYHLLEPFSKTHLFLVLYIFFSKTFTIHPAELRLHVHKGICTAGSAVTSNIRNGLTAQIICCTAEKTCSPQTQLIIQKVSAREGLILRFIHKSAFFYRCTI